MIKNIKRIGTVVFALGLVVLTSACATDSNSESKNKSSAYEEKSYSINADKIKQMSISDSGRKVELVKSKDNKIHINYFINDKVSYDINVTDENKLVMKSINNKKWKDYIGLDKDKSKRKVQIAIPNDIDCDIKINTSKGDIVLSDVSIAGSVDALTSNGEIKVTNVSVDDMLKTKTKNDDLILSDVKANGSIDVENSNGNVNVKKIEVEDILSLKSKNGDINGSVIGSYDDFNISSEASKGKNNLPENKIGGDKELKVSTNNGDINLKFVD